MGTNPEVAARQARWAGEALKRLRETIAAVVRGVDDPAADAAMASLVARLAELQQGGRK